MISTPLNLEMIRSQVPSPLTSSVRWEASSHFSAIDSRLRALASSSEIDVPHSPSLYSTPDKLASAGAFAAGGKIVLKVRIVGGPNPFWGETKLTRSTPEIKVVPSLPYATAFHLLSGEVTSVCQICVVPQPAGKQQQRARTAHILLVMVLVSITLVEAYFTRMMTHFESLADGFLG